MILTEPTIGHVCLRLVLSLSLLPARAATLSQLLVWGCLRHGGLSYPSATSKSVCAATIKQVGKNQCFRSSKPDVSLAPGL